jgi:hypothetical protein
MQRYGQYLVIFMAILLAVFISGQSQAAGQKSAGYAIEADTLSGGGTTIGSTSYQLTATLAQPSPMGVFASTRYSDQTGFWYAMKLKPFAMPWLPLLLLGE